MEKGMLPGVHRVAKKLRDGCVKLYYYAWRGGPPLVDKNGKPLDPRDPQFHVAYVDAHKARTTPATGTFLTIIDKYKTGEDGLIKRGATTQRNYLHYIKLIEPEFGDLTYKALQDRKVRSNMLDWRNEIARERGHRSADQAWMVLKLLVRYGFTRGLININVLHDGDEEKFYAGGYRAHIIWQEHHIAAFLKTAPEHLIFVMIVALWTGQRIGDLVNLTWMQYDGKKIRRIIQRKRNKHDGPPPPPMIIPVGDPLKIALDARMPKNREGTILTHSRGERWTVKGLQSSWDAAFVKAGLDGEDLHFHDLRGTAVTRLAMAQCTEMQIAAITGHTLDNVHRILAHYVGAQEELAEQAIIKLNAWHQKQNRTVNRV